MLPDHVHRKRVKGRDYLYFATGKRDAKGKAIFERLPDFGTAQFFRDYARLKDARDGKASPGCLMVAALCDRYENSPKFKSRRPATRASYSLYLKTIRREFNTFQAADVTPADVAVLIDKMSARPGAANQCVRTLSAMYGWAKSPKVGLVGHNPAEGAELFEGGEYEPWPEWLLEEALAADDEPRVQLATALLYFTGQRIGDTCAMGWWSIRGEQVTVSIDVTQQKTGTELDVALHSRLREILAKVPRGLTTIICKADGTPYSVSTVRVWLKEFATARGANVVPHGLRKNAVNSLLEVGCSSAEVSAVTGQSLQMIEHYAKKRNRKKLSARAVRKWENEA